MLVRRNLSQLHNAACSPAMYTKGVTMRLVMVLQQVKCDGRPEGSDNPVPKFHNCWNGTFGYRNLHQSTVYNFQSYSSDRQATWLATFTFPV